VAQDKPFEIYGAITCEYKGKIFLFFDGHYRQNDSLSSVITNEKFYFTGKVPLRILGKLHMDQTS
jgi:hypothetical protein